MPYISLHYNLITSVDYPPTSSWQCSNFSSMIKDKKDSWVSIYTYDDGYFYKDQLIEQISKVACIPYCTIVEIYVYHRTYIDEYKNYIKAFDCNGKRYTYKGEQTIYYAHVNLYIDSVFYNINNTQLQSDSNKKNLENQVSDLNRTISNLNSQNWESNLKINDLTTQNKELIKKQENINREMTKKNSNCKEILII